MANVTIIDGDETTLLLTDTGSAVVAQQAEAARDDAVTAAATAAAEVSASLLAQTAADRAQTGADRIAASSSASAAAASVPATADRTVGRRLNDTAIWSMVRATPAWGFGVTGNLEEAPIDTVQWEFDTATLAPFGLVFAGARTNIMTNPRFEGGSRAIGVIGSGGVYPTGVTFTGAGVTQEILGFADWRGAPAMQLRLTAASAPSSTTLGLPGSITATSSDNVIFSGFVWVSGGFSANITQSFWAGVTGGVAIATVPQISTTAALLVSNRVSTGIAQTCGFRLNWTAGSVIDVTLTIALPQAENAGTANFASGRILPAIGAPAISTRAQGISDISVQQLGTRWNRRQGILIVDWNSQPGPFTSAADADWFGLISWGDRTANERLGILINPAHTSIQARCTAGGVVQTASPLTITAPAAGVTTRAAVAWDRDAGFLQVAARGSVGTKVALTALPIPGWIMPGRFGTTNPLFGRLQGAEVRPAALFDAGLAALT
jgi:hypothetical protein